EASIWAWTRPRVWCDDGIDEPGCRERIVRRGASFAAYVLLENERAESRPFLGVGVRGDGALSGHAGALVRMHPRVGLRLEAAAIVLLPAGAAYELLAGAYFLP